MGQRIAGIAFLKVDGVSYALKGGFTVSPDTIEREGIAGQDRVHGYREVPRVPYIEGDVSMVAELSVETLRAVTNATVQAELADGRAFVLREAWTASAFEIDTDQGQMTVRFEGMSCDEIR